MLNQGYSQETRELVLTGFFLLLKRARKASGPLHMLLLLPGTRFPQLLPLRKDYWVPVSRMSCSSKHYMPGAERKFQPCF